MAKVSNTEKNWLAEMDADTMARYEEIISNKTRMNKAIKVAQSRAKDLQKRASIMSKVGSRKK